MSYVQWLVRDCRAKAINQWLFLSNKSPALAAKELNDHACKSNLREASLISRPPKGATLQDWVIKNSAPTWACIASIDLCLDSGWVPGNVTEWVMYAYFFIRKNNVKNAMIDEVSSLIDDRIDKVCALGWIAALLEIEHK